MSPLRSITEPGNFCLVVYTSMAWFCQCDLQPLGQCMLLTQLMLLQRLGLTIASRHRTFIADAFATHQNLRRSLVVQAFAGQSQPMMMLPLLHPMSLGQQYASSGMKMLPEGGPKSLCSVCSQCAIPLTVVGMSCRPEKLLSTIHLQSRFLPGLKLLSLCVHNCLSH